MLEEVIEEYVKALEARAQEQQRKNNNTIIAYHNDLRQFCNYVRTEKQTEWSEITSEELATYIAKMHTEQAYQPSTIARKLATLKSFFHYLYKKGMVYSDPTTRLDVPRVEKEHRQIVTSEQISQLFALVDTNTAGGLRDLSMLYVLSATGIRASELIALSMEDFNEVSGTLQCQARGRRHGQEHELQLTDEVLVVIQRYLEQARPRLLRYPSEAALFLNHHGERLTRQGFWLIVKRYARQTGMESITPHMLRHSSVTAIVKAGMEMQNISKSIDQL